MFYFRYFFAKKGAFQIYEGRRIMSKIKALLKLLKLAAKYGPKAIKYLKAAFKTIWHYGTKGVNWAINNFGKIVNAIAIATLIADFVE